MFQKNKLLPCIVLLFLIGFGIWGRIVNLFWGAPYFFHPDENNIIFAITHISFPYKMNPHLFAYGSFPIYVIYFVAYTINHFRDPSFAQIGYSSRFIASFLSISLLFSLWYICKKKYTNTVAYLVVILSAFSVGFIQYAHFGTFEMWLSFLTVWFFYFSFNLLAKPSKKNVLLAGVFAGLLISTKVTTLALLPIPLFVSLYQYTATKEKNKLSLFQFFQKVSIYLFVIGTIFLTTNPYSILDSHSFISSIQYESFVATGALPVFYTQSFQNTLPVIFQLLFIYPFLLNPLILILFLVGIFYFLLTYKKLSKIDWYVILFFSILFLSQAFLFVKWSRYMVITLPFMYIITARFILLQRKSFIFLLTISSVLVSLFYCSAYLHTTFLSTDSRIVAMQWVKNHIPNTEKLLIESYDLGSGPFLSYFPNNQFLDSYSLDIQQTHSTHPLGITQDRSVIILPSQRVLRSRLLQPHLYPITYRLYTNLLSGHLNYRLVYETPCDIFCRLIYNGDPIKNVEETANVFERPTVFILVRNDHLTTLKQIPYE